jgi:hypothetical protein
MKIENRIIAYGMERDERDAEQKGEQKRKEEGVTPSNGNLVINYWIWDVRTGQVRFLAG